MSPISKTCSVVFDEVALSVEFTYENSKHIVMGYVDLGSLGRQNEVFFVQGIYKHWKQLTVYYFTKNVIKTNDLENLLVGVIYSSLQICGLTVICTACNQGSTNRSAY